MCCNGVLLLHYKMPHFSFIPPTSCSILISVVLLPFHKPVDMSHSWPHENECCSLQARASHQRCLTATLSRSSPPSPTHSPQTPSAETPPPRMTSTSMTWRDGSRSWRRRPKRWDLYRRTKALVAAGGRNEKCLKLMVRQGSSSCSSRSEAFRKSVFLPGLYVSDHLTKGVVGCLTSLFSNLAFNYFIQ